MMDSRITFGCVIAAGPGDPLEKCLDNLPKGLKDVVVFTWDTQQFRVAISKGARAIFIERPPIVEMIRNEMQEAINAEWVLMLDPDEIAHPNILDYYQEKISKSKGRFAGYWINIRMFFMGHCLDHSFDKLHQLKIFRKGAIKYSLKIHNSPKSSSMQYEFPSASSPGIDHYFVTHVFDRLNRHLIWAYYEARDLKDPVEIISNPIGTLVTALGVFQDYALCHKGLNDGIAGYYNALIHSWKILAVSMLAWEQAGSPALPEQTMVNLQGMLKDLSTLIGIIKKSQDKN